MRESLFLGSLIVSFLFSTSNAKLIAGECPQAPLPQADFQLDRVLGRWILAASTNGFFKEKCYVIYLSQQQEVSLNSKYQIYDIEGMMILQKPWNITETQGALDIYSSRLYIAPTHTIFVDTDYSNYAVLYSYRPTQSHLIGQTCKLTAQVYIRNKNYDFQGSGLLELLEDHRIDKSEMEIYNLEVCREMSD